MENEEKNEIFLMRLFGGKNLKKALKKAKNENEKLINFVEEANIGVFGKNSRSWKPFIRIVYLNCDLSGCHEILEFISNLTGKKITEEELMNEDFYKNNFKTEESSNDNSEMIETAKSLFYSIMLTYYIDNYNFEKAYTLLSYVTKNNKNTIDNFRSTTGVSSIKLAMLLLMMGDILKSPQYISRYRLIYKGMNVYEKDQLHKIKLFRTLNEDSKKITNETSKASRYNNSNLVYYTDNDILLDLYETDPSLFTTTLKYYKGVFYKTINEKQFSELIKLYIKNKYMNNKKYNGLVMDIKMIEEVIKDLNFKISMADIISEFPEKIQIAALEASL